MKIYIFGNGNLSFRSFKRYYETPLLKYFQNKEVSFLVCDFRGVDTLIMELLKCETGNVSIYHMSEKPRYLPDKYKTKVSNWNMVGGFEDDKSRDLQAIQDCTHFLAVDFNSNEKRKSGTQSNIELCLEMGKINLIELDL